MSESRQKKVIVIGDGAVGKTCFVSKVTENKFIQNYLPTLGGKAKCKRMSERVRARLGNTTEELGC